MFDIALLAGIKLLVHLFIRLLGGKVHANVLDVLADNLVGVVVVAGAGFHIRSEHAGSDRRNRTRRLTWPTRAIGAEMAVTVDVADEGCVSRGGVRARKKVATVAGVARVNIALELLRPNPVEGFGNGFGRAI